MDRPLIDEKIEALRRCVARVKERRAETVEALSRDTDRQDILVLNLTRAVQLCVDISLHLLADSTDPRAPDSMAASFDALREQGVIDANLAGQMRRAIGFRNIAVHNYREIDWQIVHAICWVRLDDFADFARSVVDWIKERNKRPD